MLLREIGKFWEEHDGPEEWRDVLIQCDDDDEGETEVRKLRGVVASPLPIARCLPSSGH